MRIAPLVPEIVRTARHDRYDLVVMGSARRDGLIRIFPGGVAQDLLAELPCDVLITGEPTEAPRR